MKVGILGGGQLARMMVLASSHLNCEIEVYSSPGQTCVEGLCPITKKSFQDTDALKQFILSCDVVTYEWENISVPQLRNAGVGAFQRFFPKLETLEIISDRYLQKSFFKTNDLPTAPFRLAETQLEVEKGVEAIGVPGILKTRREGYDGRGQRIIQSVEEGVKAWAELGSVPVTYEKFITFDRELSLVACRNSIGQMKFYPLVENLHVQGILRRTVAPAPFITKRYEDRAQMYASKIGELLNYVGVMALELFQCGDELLINEMASRVHNTGHWTIDGAITSQFENHLRAGLRMPLGDTEIKWPTAMLNLIGVVPSLGDLQQTVPGLFIHLYGKEPRPNRKIGHLNIIGNSSEELKQKLKILEPLVGL